MATYEFIKTDWFVKRINALVVPFPEELNADTLSGRVFGCDPEEVLPALKAAHGLLCGMLSELISANENVRYSVIDKYNLLWLICAIGEIEPFQNRYCIRVNKKSLMDTKMKYKPKSVVKSLNDLADNGLDLEYYRNSVFCEKQGFKDCDMVKFVWDDDTALGLWVYVRRVMEKQWYNEYDRVGNYSKTLDYSPINHTIEPYHRADMRMFLTDDRVRYDITEQMAGYDDNVVELFKMINEYMMSNHPDYAADRGFYRYLLCTVTYSYDYSKRQIGSLFLGGEGDIGFYTGFKGKELEMAYSEIENFSDAIAEKFLYKSDGNGPELTRKPDKKIMYRGKEYLCPYTSLELRFPVTDEKVAADVIKLMGIKVKCNQSIK